LEDFNRVGKTSTEVEPHTNGYDCNCEPNTARKASLKIEGLLSSKGYDSRKPLGSKLRDDVFRYPNRWTGTDEDKNKCLELVEMRNEIIHTDERGITRPQILKLEKSVIEIIEKKVKVKE